MPKTLKHIFLLGLLAAFASCRPETMPEPAPPSMSDGEMSVEFTLGFPESAGTRGIENPKTQFIEGDLIHVEGVFTMENGDEIIRYGALYFNNEKKWVSFEESKLRWPNLAVSGRFTAYYVATGNGYTGGLLNSGEDGSSDRNAVEVRLSDLRSNGDPMKAESGGTIRYGHAVSLTFRHLCSYLTLNYLEPMVSTSYWLSRKKVDGENNGFNNAFRLYLADDGNGQERLTFEFCQIADNNFVSLGSGEKGFVYIASTVSTFETDNGTSSRTNFFLEPGRYEDFSLVYKVSDNEYVEYLQYDYNKIPDSEDNPKTEPDFEAGVPYTLDINKSSGITMTDRPDGNELWDETGYVYDVEVEKFLRAVRNSTDYYYREGTENEVQILKKTATGTQLMHNVDFKFEQYDIFSGDFEPNVTGGQIFDGDHHYIHNLGCPLFYSNSGTIQNLGIKVIDTTRGEHQYLVSEEDAISPWTSRTYDLSRTGGLCRRNMETGTISNVRICDGVTIAVAVKSKKDGSRDESGNTQGNEAHNVGGIAGSNIGTIDGLYLSGTFDVRVFKHDDAKPDLFVQLNTGGLTGQNGAGGRINDVRPLSDELSVNVTNECSGDLAALYTGGICGSNSGYLTDIVLPNLKVDCKTSRGLTTYAGGICGDMSADIPAVAENGYAFRGAVSSCIVSGSVFGGNAVPFGDLTCAVLVGGIAGATLHTPVTNCSVAVSVYNDNADLTKTGIICGTGGAFGRIRKEGNDIPPITDIIAYGDYLTGASGVTGGSTSYTGSFAGIVPSGMSWNDFADKNIIVNSFPNVGQEIGGDML